MIESIRATYLVETPLAPAAAAEMLAGEQSSGTFVAVPGQTPRLQERSGARVVACEAIGCTDAPSLPGAVQPKLQAGGAVYRQAHVTIDWPLENLGPSLPNLMSTIAGNLFELKAFSGIRLLDFSVPDAFFERYPGPQFGISGTRALAGVHGRPLIGTIIKPSVGLDPEATAQLVDALCTGGIDFIKDDELQADGPHCPFEARVDAVMRVVHRHSDHLGRKVMFAFNVTGEVDEMRRRHDHVVARGGTCVMASINSVGMAGFLALRAHAQIPIHAHRNGWGYLSRAPALGFEYTAWHKFWRLAGADHMHVNGIANKFCEPDESVIRSARACLAPIDAAAGRSYRVMPVFSSGQWAGQVPATYAAMASTDLIYACGGGIAAHPDGIAAGVQSIRDAWDAAISGIPLADYAAAHPALAQAIAKFGP